MATYGYARVSSSDQSTDTQVQKLKAVGCQVVRTEPGSARSAGNGVGIYRSRMSGDNFSVFMSG